MSGQLGFCRIDYYAASQHHGCAGFFMLGSGKAQSVFSVPGANNTMVKSFVTLLAHAQTLGKHFCDEMVYFDTWDREFE